MLSSVKLLTKETEEAPAVYQMTKNPPIDRHEIGSGQFEIGCYFISFMGNPYTIVSNDETTIDVRDDFRVGIAPTSGKVGIIYKSVGDGRSPFIAPIYYQFLHKTASENLKRLELAILWQYANLLNSKWIPKGVLFSFADNALTFTGGELILSEWNAKTPEKTYIRDTQESDETPTMKSFAVNGDSFAITTPDAYFIYAQFPLDDSPGVTFRISREYWREKMFDGFLTVLFGVLNSEIDDRELVLFWSRKGKDGITPNIGENGNWFIGLIDTGIPATGPQGADGEPGPPGADGAPGAPGADGAPGPKPIQVTGLTLLSGSWSLVAGLYEYNLANANITANSIVDVIPENASVSIVKTADVLPKTVSSSGSVKLYSTNAPSGNISVTINITEKA